MILRTYFKYSEIKTLAEKYMSIIEYNVLNIDCSFTKTK